MEDFETNQVASNFLTVLKPTSKIVLYFSQWTSYLTCPQESCIQCLVQNSLKFRVKAASSGKYLEPQEINAEFSAQNQPIN